jgi:DNA-binding NarL/FixJ family response regulator
MPHGASGSDGPAFGPSAGALVVGPCPLPRDALAGRLRTALAGEVYTDPGIAGGLAQGRTRSGREEAVGELPPRERGILRPAADGHTN